MENNRFHPSFPKPNNINVRIWRYLSFDRFTWLVEKRRLYMPQPRQLEENDNFEGTMPKAQSAWWDEAIRHADSHERAVTIQENKKKLLQVIHSFRTSWFISCWHMGEHENFAFWEIYGKKSNSIAIISTFAKLEALLPSHVYVGCVRYINYETEKLETEGDTMPNLYDYIMHKRIFYQYEKEVRAVASAFFGYKDIEANKVDGSYAPKIDPQKLINEVVVHPRASSEFFAKVTKFCAIHNLPKPILSGLSQEPIA